MNLDYNKLLDDWAEDLLNEAERWGDKKNQHDVGSYKYGYYQGISEGYYMAVSKLNGLEKRKARKHKI
ncbi:hypothetical protein ACI2JA_03165 [Alkalihalobacillus sp. NPDC078783]